MVKTNPSKPADSAVEAVYSSTDLSVSMPKHKMPQFEHSSEHAYQAVHDELMLDGNSRQIQRVAYVSSQRQRFLLRGGTCTRTQGLSLNAQA
jgi:glutamate/tyrosine decarboxylase-like PLP-dependent enzyme